MSNCPVGDERYLCRLLPIKMLEALVYQQFSADEVFKSLSLAMLGKVLKDEAIINAGGSTAEDVFAARELPIFAHPFLRDYYVQLRKLDNTIFVDDVRDNWDWLLAEAAKSPALMAGIASLVKQLRDVLLLPAWLHGDFALSMQTLRKDPSGLVQQMNTWKNNLARDRDFLRIILEKYQLIKGINIGSFADAGRCKAAWRLFDNHIMAFFTGKDFATAFSESGLYGQQAAVSILRRLITVLDEAIKGVKGNAAMPSSEKLPMFQIMLDANFRLLQNLASLVPIVTTAAGDENDPLAERTTRRDDFFTMMMNIVHKDTFEDADLLPSKEATPACFAMGSGYCWKDDGVSDKISPRTGEDIFTVIHQSLIHCCSVLHAALEIKVAEPDILKNVEEALRDATRVGLERDALRFVGMDISSDEMVKYYNIALGSHGCQVAVKYRNKNKTITVTANCFGGSARFGWCAAAGLILLAGTLKEEDKSVTTRIEALADHALSAVFVFDQRMISFFQQIWRDFMPLCVMNIEGDYLEKYTKDLDKPKADKLLNMLMSFNKNDIGLEAAISLAVPLFSLRKIDLNAFQHIATQLPEATKVNHQYVAELIGNTLLSNQEFGRNVLQKMFDAAPDEDKGYWVEYLKNSNGTALVQAASDNDLKKVQTLLANPMLPAQGCDYFEMLEGKTALMAAAEAGALDVVKYLVETAHANTVLHSLYDDKTALDYARERGHQEVIRYFETAADIFVGGLDFLPAQEIPKIAPVSTMQVDKKSTKKAKKFRKKKTVRRAVVRAKNATTEASALEVK